MSEDSCEMTVGSPDSGMGEALAASLGRLLLDKEQKECKKRDEVKEACVGAQNPVAATSYERLNRGLSVSSEETAASGAEERGTPTGGRTLSRPERVAIVKELLETYFSDNYLTRDIFLLKHFRKSKEGWISLKFMASYKRIKRTAKSSEEVQEAVRESPLLEVNAEGNKVRRLAPLPPCIEEYIPSRMVLVGDLPQDLKNLVNLSQYFGGFGSVSSMQLLRPGTNLPEVLREASFSMPRIRDQWCAVVEFDEITAASQLAEAVASGSDGGSPGWALELVMPWRGGRSCEHPETNKYLCRSSPSSGYSSPSLTPDQSPVVHGRSRSFRGLTKRERIVLNRPRQQKCFHTCACQHQIPHCGYHCCPAGARQHRCRDLRTNNVVESLSPRQLTATTSDNWRAPSPEH